MASELPLLLQCNSLTSVSIADCRRCKRENYAHTINFHIRNLKNDFTAHERCHILTDERNVMLHNP